MKIGQYLAKIGLWTRV